MFDDITQGVDHRILSIGADLQQQVAMAQRGIQRIVGEAGHRLQVLYPPAKAHQNSEWPTETVMVRLSGAIHGPMPESIGGSRGFGVSGAGPPG